MGRYLPFGVKAKKAFGQNFLVDQKVVSDLVAAADLTKSDVVAEVGAGTGVLTKELAEKTGKVLAFEIDRDLIPVLKKELQGFANVEIINKDFLNFEIWDLESGISDCKVIGSIPYQITSPLIHRLLRLDPKPSLVVLLIQKEVAEKLTAKPPKATYLSNIAQLLGEVEVVRTVPKKSFWPIPQVDGAIVKFKIQSSKLKIDIEEFQTLLHKGFQNPRKMLRSKFPPEDLEKAEIPPTSRAQELGFADWLGLYGFVSRFNDLKH